MAKAKVLGIEICKEGFKEGKPVSQCNLDYHRNVTLDLDNNHWAYATQIQKIYGNI